MVPFASAGPPNTPPTFHRMAPLSARSAYSTPSLPTMYTVPPAAVRDQVMEPPGMVWRQSVRPLAASKPHSTTLLAATQATPLVMAGPKRTPPSGLAVHIRPPGRLAVLAGRSGLGPGA